MGPFELPTEIVDRTTYDNAATQLRTARVVLPTFAQLADPSRIPGPIAAKLCGVDPDAPDALNLFRVHWYNDERRTGRSAVPSYLELPQSLTGIRARIVMALGRNFPMIGAHKVLAAYGCLAPRLVTGQFDPTRDKAVWPSTGNFCRGGVAISRILGCRGVAVLPEGMSQERFDWLKRWVSQPNDIIRTPGTESNVKEIYDKCTELRRDPVNVILNQFADFGNYLSHYVCTGAALRRVFEALCARDGNLRLAAVVSATGSAGALAAGDYLKATFGTRIVAVEPIECPTMLYNGYGEHNIQGIGDKHIPLIHNIMNTDIVVGVSDRSTDALSLLFNSETGRGYLIRRRGLDPAVMARLDALGFSGIANMLGAIKVAKRLELGEEDVIITMATDSAALYASERKKFAAARYHEGFDEVNAGEVFGQHLMGIEDDHLIELTHIDRRRMFNLGYYTWVEQQGVPVRDFDRRRDQGFWKQLQEVVPVWDKLIEEFNARSAFGRNA